MRAHHLVRRIMFFPLRNEIENSDEARPPAAYAASTLRPISKIATHAVVQAKTADTQDMFDDNGASNESTARARPGLLGECRIGDHRSARRIGSCGRIPA